MSEQGAHEGARAMVRAAKPLEQVMFLFNQPPGMETPEMRRRAGRVFFAGLTLQVAVFWGTPYLMRYQGPVSRLGFFLVIAVFGTAFLLVPASLFRLIFGVTDANDGNGLVRGFVGFVLFLLSCFASCYVYANLTR